MSLPARAEGGATPPCVAGYELVRAVSTSGQSSVWEARSARGDRVALKVFREEWRERAGIEVDVLRRVSSDHLARYMGDGVTTAGEAYLATTWIEGRSLEDAHAFRRPVPIRTATILVAQMCEGLGALHRAGWAHLDLKAPNVLIASDGRVVVIDLGLAMPLGSIVGSLLGTPQLCAPEIQQRVPISAAADVYALGMLLYLLLSARVPFADETPFHEVFHAWSHEEWREAHALEPVRRLEGHVPPALGALVGRCLAKSPSDRPPDAAALGDELVLLLEGAL